MNALFSGNQTRASSDLKARLEALEARYTRDVTALTHRIYNAEGEINELRALNASLTDSLDEFRRRIAELEMFKTKSEQPRRENALPNTIVDSQPAIPPSREPRLAHPASSHLLSYRPSRQSSYVPPPVHQRRHNGSAPGPLPPEKGQRRSLLRANTAPGQQHNATDIPQSARSMSSGTNSFRDGTISPPATTLSPDSTRSSSNSEAAINGQSTVVGKIVVSIDFGTDSSAVAYGTRITGGLIEQILRWPGSDEDLRRIPSCLLYNERGKVQLWGFEAQNAPPSPGFVNCEWFKQFLEPKGLHSAPDPNLLGLPCGKLPIDVVTDFLSCLRSHILQQITHEIGAVIDLALAEVWLTVPASWNADACDLMRKVALRAGLVWGNTPPNGRDNKQKDRLKLISKAEAAAAHCAHFTDLRLLRSSQNFIICDAGGSTFDLAIYRVLGSLRNLEIGEVCVRTQANCGDSVLSLRFRDLVTRLLVRHPTHTDYQSLGYFQAAFDETVKFSFGGEEDDRALFPFSCFNHEYPDDRSIGLVNGELNIPGMLLRSEVFDPVVSVVLWFINDQIAKFGRDVDALLLVGRFAWSEHLFKRINEQFGTRIKIIARPPDTDTAACRGATRYGLENSTPMSSYIAPRSYVMKVKLPAESEDWRMRAGYITQDAEGKSICNNRIQYLIQKGAFLKKGQTIKIMFRKFSKNIEDCVFEVQVFTSDSERVMRYTDEGETSELCKWTIDLSLLPSFKERVRAENRNGFYTEFELGLRLDTNELRGVLLHNGEERGKVMSEPLNS